MLVLSGPPSTKQKRLLLFFPSRRECLGKGQGWQARLGWHKLQSSILVGLRLKGTGSSLK